MRPTFTIIVPLALTAAVVTIVCCHNNGSRNPTFGVSNISAGQSYGQVQQALAGPGTHEFTLMVDNEHLLCVSYAFGHPANRFYFVMQHDRLIRLTRPPPFANRIKTDPDGARVSVLLPVNPEDRLKDVMSSDNLLGRDLKQEIYGGASATPSNLGPAAGLVGMVNAAGRAEVERQYKRNGELKRHFDPFVIDLGMTADQVVAHYGEALQTETSSDGSIIAVYGKREDLPEVNDDLFSWLLVKYQDNRVASVYSHDFFPSNLRTK